MDSQFINTCFPITGIEIYKNNCYKLQRTSLLQGEYTPKGGSRIVTFTKKSLANLIFTVNATDVEFHSMITLTYPNEYPANGVRVKEDLRVFTQWLQRKLETNIIWFLEFQKRGAPHFHILTEIDAITPNMRVMAGIKWIQRIIEADWFMTCFREFSDGQVIGFQWQEYKAEVVKIAKFNMRTEVWELAKHPNGMRNYAAKYAAKQYQKEVPKDYTEVGRFWGCSDNVRPVPTRKVDTCEDDIRMLLQAADHTAQDYEILPKLLFNVVNS